MSPARLVIPDLAEKVVLHNRGLDRHRGGAGARLCRPGREVAIDYHSSETAANALLAEIEGAGGEATLVRGDVTGREACERIVAETAGAFGGSTG